MSRIIISDPHNGLCNKLRNLISSMRMAEYLDARFIVKWVPWGCCGASFTELFKNDFEIESGQENGKNVLTQVNQEYIDPRHLDTYDVVKIGGHKPFSFDKSVRAWTSEFWHNVRPFFYQLEPVDEVTHLINLVAPRINSETIGVHIRRGDHGVARAVSRHELFVEEIESSIKTNPNYTFYVSTECKETINSLVNQFGDRIINIKDCCDIDFMGVRNTHHAIRVALAEVVLLSKTRFIIGSARSSFSTFPAIMGDVPFKRMGSGEHFADDHYVDMNKEDLVNVPCH